MKAETGREQARRRGAAELRGRLEALQAQVTELTRTLAERQGPLSRPRPSFGTKNLKKLK